MITEVTRSYEVSLWTLQDEFITVLKWSNIESKEALGFENSSSIFYSKTLQKGTIQNPLMTIADDGTQNFSFTIPMYIYEGGQLIENPLWYNTRNGNLMVNLRKIKVIFNKHTEDKKIFEFLITKITEEHESDHLFCKVECEGLAFHELGKIGYIYDLSLDDFDLVYKHWVEGGDGIDLSKRPIQNVQFWCNLIKLDPLPDNMNDVDPKKWYYKIDMDYSSYSDVRYENDQRVNTRESNKVYEDPFVKSWEYDENLGRLKPKEFEMTREKERTIEINNSNIYNITQTIAETFGIFCRYDYIHNDNNQIVAKVIVFFNNFIHDDDIMGLTYPYSSSSVTREIDSTDVVTKMYVQTVDDSTTLLGEASIVYSEANKSKENYIFNFDYLKEVGGITDEQYEAIEQFETDMYRINTALVPLENKIALYENEINDLQAKQTILTNSVALDQEQINDNQDYILSLTVTTDGVADQYISSYNNLNPDQAVIVTDDEGNYCIKLNSKKKGIRTDSVQLYRTYNSIAHTFGTELSGFYFKYDEYNNPTHIYGVAPENDSSIVYMTYSYEPKIYYESIVKTWTEKLGTDNTQLEEVEDELDEKSATLAQAREDRDALLVEKENLISEFNYLMSPALREGYWTPENYTDYGQKYIRTHALPTDDQGNAYFDDDFLSQDTGTDFEVGWDSKLFEGEQDIYYEESVQLTKVYYPCINLSSLITQPQFQNNLDKLSFVFYSNYYDASADAKTKIKNIRAFAFGSEALLGFVKNSAGKVYPTLILVGAKNMSTDNSIVTGGTIGFMLDSARGAPRLSVLTTTVSNGTATLTEDVKFNINNSSYFSFGGDTISDCEVVYPRIKFSSLMLKTDEDLYIRYFNTNSTPLSEYDDYYIRTRQIAADNYETSYLITLKPKTLIAKGDYKNSIRIDYTLSNASDSIYLDAIEIEKENAYPKVSYTVNPSILDRRIITTLYNKLNWLVLINDAQLKLSEAFGYISKLELNLDFPDQDTVEVKNYKTKFEDIFTTIVAQTETMKQNSNSMTATLSGDMPLSSDGLTDTLTEQQTVLEEYLDDYVETSDVLSKKLTGLFDEAGKILSNANQSLKDVASLSQENAEILGGFASDVNKQLTVQVYTGTQKPTTFKVGDVWIQEDSSGNIIGRYVATAASTAFTADRSGFGGFTRTYDGTLASITGANLDIDADKGKISIAAKNEINIASGGYLYLAANQNVDIVGNEQVNIGGATINIAALTKDGTNYPTGGINLISNSTTSGSRILMTPQQITMGGSTIEMYTASTGTTSALKLDGSSGVWIGSDKKISLFSTDNNSQSANVEISPSHILFGMNNISSNSSTAIELTTSQILLGAGRGFASLQSNGISTINNMAGVQITNSKIALAIGTGTGRSAIIMDSSGLKIGAGANSDGVLGSLVTITNSKVDIGTGDFMVTTSNNCFKIISNAEATNPSLYIANNASWESATNGIQYTPNGGLEIKGKITANQFILAEGASISGLSYNDLEDKPASFSINGISSGTRDIQTTNGSQTVTTTVNTVEVTATGGLVLGGNEGVYVVADSNSRLDQSYLAITKDKIWLDNSVENYIHMDANGLAISGNRITINNKEVWARDDIIILRSTDDETTVISNTQANRNGDWVLIKPYYNATVVQPPSDASILSQTDNNSSYFIYGSFNNPSNIHFGDGSSWYDYNLTASMTTTVSSGSVSGTVSSFTVYLSNTAFTGNNNSAANALVTLDFTTVNGYINSSGQYNGGQIASVTVRTQNSSSGNPVNLCREGSIIYYKIHVEFNHSYHSIKISDFILTCTCDASTSKVPCTVYYFPPTS